MATTLNAFVMKVGMDTREVAYGSAQVRKDVAKVNAVIRKAKTDTQKYNEAKAALTRRLEMGGISLKKYRKALAAVHQEYITTPKRIAAAKEAEQKANEVRRRTIELERRKAAEIRRTEMAARQAAMADQRMRQQAFRAYKTQIDSSMPRRLGASFAFLSPQALAATAAVSGFYMAGRELTDSLKLAASLQEIGVQFEVMTGSAESGDKLIRQMRELSNTTALTFSSLQTSARTMLSFGVSSEKVMPALRAIGDITAGDAERMKSLSLAFAQTQSAGRLMGQDLLQMINAGFNPLQEISRKTGKSMADLKKEMEQGAISSEMVASAFVSATQEGGRFFQMLEKSQGTLAGQTRLLSSEYEKLKTTLGQALVPPTTSIVKEMNHHLGNTMKMIDLLAGRSVEESQQVKDAANEAESAMKRASKAAASVRIGGDMSKMERQAYDAAASTLQAMENQRLALALGRDYADLVEFARSGATKAQVAEFERLQKLNKSLQQQEEQQRRITQENERRVSQYKSMAEAGKKLMEEHNPVSAVGRQLGELRAMVQMGMIDTGTAMREQQRILKENASVKKDPGFAQVIEVGSQQWVDTLQQDMIDERDKQLQKMEEQRLLQESMKDSLKESNRLLAELQPVRRLR